METQFLAIFLLFKKGTATSMFKCSTALYKNICSTCVQILGDLSVWALKLCFSEVRKHVVKLKSLDSSTSFFTIKVNFVKIQFEDYGMYRPNCLLGLKYILFTSKRFPGFLILYLDNYLCYEENETTGKKIYFIRNMKYLKKNKAPIRKRGNLFWGEGMYVSLSKRRKLN